MGLWPTPRDEKQPKRHPAQAGVSLTDSRFRGNDRHGVFREGEAAKNL